jgi:hypothetical protein
VLTAIVRFFFVAAFFCAAVFADAVAAAQTAPAPSPAPAAPSDPCASILSIVNRPSFGTGVCTVRTGRFDIENGITHTTTTGEGGGSASLYPQSLVRVGTSDPHLDLEFGLPSIARSSSGGATVSGWSDASIGVKYELGYTSKADWGANAALVVPTGSAAFTAGKTQFTGGFNWGYTINAEFGLAGTLDLNESVSANASGVPQSYFAAMPSLALSAALPGGPSQITAEYAYFTAAGPNLGGKAWLDFIYSRDLGPHVQIDVEYGLSPTPIGGQRQHYVGAGLSFMN